MMVLQGKASVKPPYNWLGCIGGYNFEIFTYVLGYIYSLKHYWCPPTSLLEHSGPPHDVAVRGCLAQQILSQKYLDILLFLIF